MWQHAICHKIYQSRRGGPGRNLKSCANQASFLAPCVGLIFILVIRQHGARYVRVIRITCALLLGSLGIPGLLQSRWCHESSMLSGLWTGGNRRYQAVALQLGYALRSLSSTPANVRRALLKKLSVLEASVTVTQDSESAALCRRGITSRAYCQLYISFF